MADDLPAGPCCLSCRPEYMGGLRSLVTGPVGSLSLFTQVQLLLPSKSHRHMPVSLERAAISGPFLHSITSFLLSSFLYMKRSLRQKEIQR